MAIASSRERMLITVAAITDLRSFLGTFSTGNRAAAATAMAGAALMAHRELAGAAAMEKWLEDSLAEVRNGVEFPDLRFREDA